MDNTIFFLERDLAGASIDDLERHTDEWWDEPDDLKVVLFELFHRKSKRAGRLKNKIRGRLEELTGCPSIFKSENTIDGYHQ